ncbi:hypothetical protein KFL_000690160 [Klebsormidium nitens]|uniref:MYND-type domain-containing protein n=1 Tax=Klebsormidium nitens TaxID=105231 RepID=A0A1Y1HX02_KLENI|nr:hypothetical protein KFL_000690160 [Klebsormidium nitens]|eukprot:GAQ81036.1 hypothetical protein KFL_000690160 [Klebsormidium nitens]
MHLLQDLGAQLKLHPQGRVLEPTAHGQANKDYYTTQLVAVANCPGFMLDLRPMLYLYLSIFHALFRPFLLSGGPGQCTPAQDQELQKYLAANPTAMARRRQICNILAPAKPPLKVRQNSQPSSPRPEPASAKSATASAYVYKPIENPLGFVPGTASYWYGDDAKSRRKCSHSSCSEMESASRRFKVCSGCKLAIYCSQDCQKAAWKGHKSRCRTVNKGGGSK